MFLVASGFPAAKSFGFTLVITLVQLPGYAASALLVEKVDRRVSLASFLAGSALSALAFGMTHSEPAIIAAG